MKNSPNIIFVVFSCLFRDYTTHLLFITHMKLFKLTHMRNYHQPARCWVISIVNCNSTLLYISKQSLNERGQHYQKRNTEVKTCNVEHNAGYFSRIKSMRSPSSAIFRLSTYVRCIRSDMKL